MTTKIRPEVELIFKKFDKVLGLLKKCNDSSASLSKNVAFLLTKALDHIEQLWTKACSLEMDLQDKEDVCIILLKRPMVQTFLLETCRISRINRIHPQIIIFAIKLVTQFSSTNKLFQETYFANGDIYANLAQMTETTAVENSEIKHALLNLYNKLARHQLGLKWVVQNNITSFGIKCLHDNTLFTRQSSQDFILCILQSLEADHRKEILFKLFDSLLQAKEEKFHTLVEIDRLKPILSLLNSFMEISLEKNSEKIGIELTTTKLEKNIINFIYNFENPSLVTELCYLLASLYAKSAQEDEVHLSMWEDRAAKIIQILVSRGFICPALKVISHSLFLWGHVEYTKEFKQQLMYLMVIPILYDTEELADHYVEYRDHLQSWNTSAHGAMKIIGEKITAVLSRSPEINELTSITLAGFYKCIDKLGKGNALKITRAGMYLLSCLKMPGSKRGTHVVSTPPLAIHLTKALCSFIEKYNIRWWESVETVCLPLLLTKLVTFNACRNTQVACAGLYGLKFCIKQFLHPNQTLLVNNTADSTLNDIAEVVYHSLVSHHWEIRDSSLEVIAEMTKIAESRYPEFQQLLIHANLLKATATATEDTEAYVRATALSVISEATSIPILWEHLNSIIDVCDTCYSVLQNDSEALVRRAAVRTLTRAFEGNYFPETTDRSKLFCLMSSAVLSDLDWEVKLHGLEFWEAVMKERFTRIGMIDESFPEYTFSTKTQKIIRLDTKEIRSRLQEVLTELSTCGCLHILLQSTDDCDVAVRQRSIRLLHYIKDVLAKYGALDLTIYPLSSRENEAKSGSTVPQAFDSNSSDDINPIADEIINDILAESDVNLVKNIITDSVDQVGKDLPPLTVINPSEFITKINVMELQTMLEFTSVSSDLHEVDLNCLVNDLEDSMQISDIGLHPDCY